MTTLFLYVMAASSDPDHVECLVPCQINREEIFFGPCKKLLRRELRDRYLKESESVAPEQAVFVVGVNGSNQTRCRKIVWAGQITHLMTFEAASMSLTDSRYQEMRNRQDSPLHLKPLYDGTGKFKGYEHCSFMHEKNDAWVRDLTHSNNPRVQQEGKRLLLAPNTNRYQAFPRDCCFLLKNLFFAQGAGIPFTADILTVLKEAQDHRQDIDSYGIFGYRADGSADGRAGGWLEISGKKAKALVHLMKASILTSSGMPLKVPESRVKSCRCH